MAFNINDIKQNFKLQGARPTLFQVVLPGPDQGDIRQKLSISEFVISATTIPESQLGNIAVPYFGRIINFAGDRTYNPWTVSVMNDEDFKVRDALETWSDLINGKQSNLRNFEQDTYKVNAQVRQFDKQGSVIREYEFVGLYPSIIEPINLNWRDVNQFENFNVQFIYDYWRVIGGNTGSAGEIG